MRENPFGFSFLLQIFLRSDTMGLTDKKEKRYDSNRNRKPYN